VFGIVQRIEDTQAWCVPIIEQTFAGTGGGKVLQAGNACACDVKRNAAVAAIEKSPAIRSTVEFLMAGPFSLPIERQTVTHVRTSNEIK
jgi:hypothetical protein